MLEEASYREHLSMYVMVSFGYVSMLSKCFQKNTFGAIADMRSSLLWTTMNNAMVSSINVFSSESIRERNFFKNIAIFVLKCMAISFNTLIINAICKNKYSFTQDQTILFFKRAKICTGIYAAVATYNLFKIQYCVEEEEHVDQFYHMLLQEIQQNVQQTQQTINRPHPILPIVGSTSNPIPPVTNLTLNPILPVVGSTSIRRFDTFVNIDVNRNNINSMSDMKALYNALAQGQLNQRVQMRVRFLEENGQDGGGLSREFLNLLFAKIATSKYFSINEESSLALPQLQDSAGEAIFQEEDIQNYKIFGKLCMVIYRNIKRSGGLDNIGLHFIPTTFAALNLPIEDFSGPYSISVKIKLARQLLMHDPSYGQYVRNLMEKFLDLLEQVNLLRNQEDMKQLLEDLNLLQEEEVQVFSMRDGLEKQHKLRELLLEKFSSLSIGKNSCLQPLYAIGVGMREVLVSSGNANSWPENNATDFSDTLQGSLTNQDVIECLNYTPGNEHTDQKVEWTKDWINEASPAQLRKFLIFVTGCSALSTPRSPIYLQSMFSYSRPLFPIPKSSTCAQTLYLSDTPSKLDEYCDDTKEGFHKCLNKALECEDFGNP